MRPHSSGIDHQHPGTTTFAHVFNNAFNLSRKIFLTIAQAPGSKSERQATRNDVAADRVTGVGGLGNSVVFNDEKNGHIPD